MADEPTDPPVAPAPGYAGIQSFDTDYRIPEGGRLIRVSSPTGSDAPYLYFVTYTVFGVTMSFEVGDQRRLNELFGGVAAFDDYQSMSQTRFDARGWLEMGSIDEQLGATESIQSQIERGVREMGFEDIPRWMRRPETATVLFQSMSEGWSAGRTLQALSQTRSFQQRFTGLQGLQGVMGGATLSEAVDEYLARETSIRDMLVAYRGENSQTGNRYIGRLIASGWAPTEIEDVLRGEQLLRANPGAMRDLNRILSASGLERVTAAGFLRIMQGNAAPQVYEAINDTLRAQALREQGIAVNAQLAAELGEGVAFGVASATEQGQFTAAAQNAAMAIMSNRLELEAGKFGITRNDIIRAAFGEGYSEEVEIKLRKFDRERQQAAEGYGATSGYQTGEGRLVIPGLQGL